MTGRRSSTAPFGAVRATAAATRLVFGNRDLRRVNVAWAGSLTGDNAFATAIAVWAYGYGGVKAVSAYTVIRLMLIAAGLPISSLLLDRVPHRPFVVTADLARIVLVAAAAVLIWTGGPPLVVLALAVAVSVITAPLRPAQTALLPALARTPHELIAANAVGSTLEGVAFFLGPALAGLLLLLSGVPAVFALYALTFVGSTVLLLRLGTPSEAQIPQESGTTHESGEPTTRSEGIGGFRAVLRDRRLLLVGGLSCAQTVVSGAALVFVVVVAHELTGLGDPAVGYLSSILGVGAVLGGVLAISRSIRARVARDFGWGVLLWSAAPLVMVAWPSPIAAFVAFALMGLANPLVDVNTVTLVQRLAPPASLARVLLVLEAGLLATMAFGALVMPPLLSVIGLRWSLLAVGLPMIAVVMAFLPALRRLDRTVAPPVDLGLISAVPLFAVLPPSAQEALARRLVTVGAPAGTVVMREGHVGDRFYLIRSGRLDAVRGTTILNTMTNGDCFGEIALLRDVPRTASVVAREDSVLAALDRRDFLQAVAIHPQAAARAENLAARRLGVTGRPEDTDPAQPTTTSQRDQEQS